MKKTNIVSLDNIIVIVKYIINTWERNLQTSAGRDLKNKQIEHT